jgi:diguanylate cyclase (GGDEF)-like protein/PAS domain S-box-containing protein
MMSARSMHVLLDVARMAERVADPATAEVLRTEAARARGIAEGDQRLLGFGLAVVFALAPLAALIVRRELQVRHEAEAALATSEARFRAATDASLDAFYVLRAVRDSSGAVLDFEFVDINRSAEALLGLARADVVGQRICELVPATRSNGFLAQYITVMTTGEVHDGEVEVQGCEMRAAWVHQQVVPLGDGVAITSRDVTERKQHEDALKALSLVDELTGLYNRRGFLTLATQQLKQARRGNRELLLLFVDMDDFKEINDTLGHAEGDAALRSTAAILRRTFRDSDIIARMGGDEFVVLATDIGRGTDALIVERLRSELREANAQGGAPYRLSFSVGAAHFDPVNPPSIEELLATADAMLYEQKRHKHEHATV